MKFEQVCQTALAYFQQHPVFRVLLPIATPLMLACVALRLLQNLVNMGGLVSTLIFYIFILALVLTVAQCNFRMAAVGLAGFALDRLLSFLISLIRYHSISYGVLLTLVIYGGLAFLSYKKSMMFNR